MNNPDFDANPEDWSDEDEDFLPDDEEDFGDPLDDDEDVYLQKRFANPGGNSALYRESPENPRNLPCPTCGMPNRLTPRDVQAHYQCDECADAAEGGGY